LTKVLEGIQDRARMTGLSLRKFAPKDDVQQDFYSGKRIDVSVQSSFAGLRAFFDQMAHYQRIVSITNFELKQMDKQAASTFSEFSACISSTPNSASALIMRKPAPAPK